MENFESHIKKILIFLTFLKVKTLCSECLYLDSDDTENRGEIGSVIVTSTLAISNGNNLLFFAK